MTDSSTKKGMGAEGSKISGGNGSECSMGILNTEHATVGNANQKSMVGSELIDILDGCMPVEEGRRIKTYIRRSLFLSLLHLYDEIFVSHFVKREDFRSFMEKVNQHYDQCYAHHEDTGDDKTQIKDGCLKAASSNYLRTSENDGLFKLKNYEASTFVVPMDQFKTALINDHIRKSDILADPKRYAGLSSLIGFLKSLRCRFESREISFLLELYELSFSRQLLLDFFYYFDLLYRQGSYFYYLNFVAKY
ncbi:uncharacterized protein VICG_00645 [Vittaforma corneae ATCC 50505]|uniref:Uncharacterized protein n=1 Tax=Vittaforma corneae (strain ATCC 50505) TaxID=993615 RepID=L2GN42_VITCO|nr:uncharacterized protein VICG_00645 [Vittaforma corneae ATCC 50505]ELA42246.1 hypothetical protein VICG_00645 [Vittaforma corneae ATCC 50505]